jgi:hypothetical protein
MVLALVGLSVLATAGVTNVVRALNYSRTYRRLLYLFHTQPGPRQAHRGLDQARPAAIQAPAPGHGSSSWPMASGPQEGRQMPAVKAVSAIENNQPTLCGHSFRGLGLEQEWPSPVLLPHHEDVLLAVMATLLDFVQQLSLHHVLVGAARLVV